MPRRKPPEDEPEEVLDDDDAPDDEDDEDPDAADDDESDDEASDDEEWLDFHEPDAASGGDKSGAGAREEEESPPRPRKRGGAPRGPGGMGRPSTAPRQRPPMTSASVAADGGEPLPITELAPDISSWPGTAEASKLAGRHPSTIKLWRTQGRVRAIQDASGCWRYNPDDLVENVDTPDQTDPGSVLAAGMTAIVQQGSSASERLLSMTELATKGLQDATGVLSEELKRAYARIRELEEKLAEAREKLSATHAEDLKHERHMRRLDQKHELTLAGAQETSERIAGLLTVIGPIAASIGARLLGHEQKAQALEAGAMGAAPAAPPAPEKTVPVDDMTSLEAKITDAMSRLCVALRSMNPATLAGLRAMMPEGVQHALDEVVSGQSDNAVGKALAVIITAAQNLSDLQFATLRPITPVDVANALADLRALIKSTKDPES